MSDDEKFYREDWMTDEQWRCAKVAAILCHGFHHILNLEPCGQGVSIEQPGEIATFDVDRMTVATVLAHDHCVRIGAGIGRRTEQFEGNQYEVQFLELTFHPRSREGAHHFQRHPGLEDHVELIRKHMPSASNAKAA